MQSIHFPKLESSIFNVGTGNGISVSDLAKMISVTVESMGGPDSDIYFTEEREGDVRISISDTSGSMPILDPEKMILLEQGIRDLIGRTLDEPYG